ncbi:immunoglobulin lambda-1 light chain-like isoform X2 [Pristis pectinata]|uniref:immunoglobulin lambda-1 light chain-like isoform X2 n=1 Tax=Pristis pectinata TaxID=685728 RepID=UPI00223E7C68|nr:immunoglobulin lambda-1 light chain-like isoform X2 [Pristis pectinata]
MSYWIRVVGTLAFCALCLNAEVRVNQPPSKSVSPGQNAQLTCTLSGCSSGISYVSWNQQIPGNTPRLLLYYHAASVYKGPGIPDRFSVSVSGMTSTFTIPNVQSEDAADYYCAVWVSSATFFGQGTRLSIGKPRAPVVTVLPPSADEVTAKGTATLVCLVNGFNPGAVNIEWTVDGSARSNGVETSPIQQETDNTFSTSSYLTLPAVEWKTHELYSCVVKHESQANPFKENIERSRCV